MHSVLGWEFGDDVYAVVEFRVRVRADSVYLVGSFTSWHPGVAPLSRVGEDEWVGTFRVREGRHYYAFMLNAREKYVGECERTSVDVFGEACALPLINGVSRYAGTGWRFRDGFNSTLLERVRTLGEAVEGYRDLGEVDGLRWWEREVSEAGGGEAVSGGGGGCVLEPPRWAVGAVFYQVFPSSFMRDFRDLGDKLGHVAEIADAVYLNPIWESPSYHGYDIVNYFKVRGEYGGNAGFLEFLDRAHSMGLRVVLDGVFNHMSSAHPVFQDVVERGRGSPFHDWFLIYGDRPDPFQFNYESFLWARRMPRLNYGNGAVRRFALDVGEYWVRAGADGWRLDVAHGIPPSFLRGFTEAMTRARSDAYVLGEVWGEPDPWVCSLHGITNFAVHRFVNGLARGRLSDAEVRRLRLVPRGFLHSSWNFIDNHDTPRLLTEARGDARVVRLGLAIVFAMPGAPLIYYGDEVGLEGGGDPDNRRPMPWDREKWDLETLGLVKKLVEARRTLPQLAMGDWELEVGGGGRLVRVRRRLGRRWAELVANPLDSPAAAEPGEGVGTDLITGRDVRRIELGPYGFALVVP